MARALSTRMTGVALHTATTDPLDQAHVHQLGPLAQRPRLPTLPGAQAPRLRHTVVLAQTRHGAQAPRHLATVYRHPPLVPQITTRGATHLPSTHPHPELGSGHRPLGLRSTHPRLVHTMHLHLARLMRRRRVAGRVAGAQMPHQLLVQQQHLHLEQAVAIIALRRLVLMALQRRQRPAGRGTRMMTERGHGYMGRKASWGLGWAIGFIIWRLFLCARFCLLA